MLSFTPLGFCWPPLRNLFHVYFKLIFGLQVATTFNLKFTKRAAYRTGGHMLKNGSARWWLFRKASPTLRSAPQLFVVASAMSLFFIFSPILRLSEQRWRG